MGLVLLFGLLAGFCLVWIVAVEAKYRDPIIRDKPQPDARRDVYRNFDRDWKSR